MHRRMLRGAIGIWAPLLLPQTATNLAVGRSECSPLPTSSSTGTGLNVGSVCLWHPKDRGVYGHAGIWLPQEISQGLTPAAVVLEPCRQQDGIPSSDTGGLHRAPQLIQGLWHPRPPLHRAPEHPKEPGSAGCSPQQLRGCCESITLLPRAPECGYIQALNPTGS